jgi:putative NADH-flavin reductase
VNILVFGAAGGTGRALVTEALAQGHGVAAFVRTPAKFDLKHVRLCVVHGDVIDADTVDRAVAGHDAVLCAPGAATPFRRDPALVSGVDDIVRAMERYGPRRLIYLSFLGVRGKREQLSLVGRHIVAPLILRNTVADHETKESIIARSSLDWTIVLPPRLTNRPHRITPARQRHRGRFGGSDDLSCGRGRLHAAAT